MYKIYDSKKQVLAFVYDDFISKEDCDFIIEVSKPLMKDATTVAPQVEDYRTNSNCFINYGTYGPVDALAYKVSEITKSPIENFESLQVNHYTHGQRYKKHHDYFDGDKDSHEKHLKRGGQRTWTALIYLNDVESGGETIFNNINEKIKPKQGTVVIWKNSENGKLFVDSMHEALPTVNCEKWSANVWIREKTFNSDNKLIEQHKPCCGKRKTQPKSENVTEKSLPGMGKQALNFAKSAVKHAAGGFEQSTFEEYVERLMWCSSCEYRDKDRCTECGCFVSKKAHWRAEDCPKGKWPKI